MQYACRTWDILDSVRSWTSCGEITMASVEVGYVSIGQQVLRGFSPRSLGGGIITRGGY